MDLNKQTVTLIASIKNHTPIKTKDSFNQYIDFFLNPLHIIEREKLYNEIMNTEKFTSLAESKHFILINLFSDYISHSIVEANHLNSDDDSYGAKIKIDELQKLANIFKSHDGINYKEFISQVEPRLSLMEISLLFYKAELNQDELENIRTAIINALGKKHTELSTKDEFQSKFFNHPLINCLNAYHDVNFIHNQIQNDTFEFGHYENLIKTLVKLNTKEINEEYQGFITFLIKEDLISGFSKILKNPNYKPKYLQELLKKITEGVELDDVAIKNLITEIKNNHTKNFRLDSNQKLVQNKSSKHSLNDFGFYFNIGTEEIFFHGHETIGTGINQNNQQANTALVQRKFKKDTIGLTILGNNVTRDESHKCWINAEGFKGLVNLTKLEEVALTGLQFDCQNFKVIALNREKNIEILQNGNFLNSNHYIVKSDIQRSKNIINAAVGKNDLELIFEKKNLYLNIFKNNVAFFQQVLKTTSSNNQAQYQLVSEPFLEFIKAVKKIEKNNEISIFTHDDIKILIDILEPVSKSTFNVSISSHVDDVMEILETAKYTNFSEKHTELTNLCTNDTDKELSIFVTKKSKYDNDNAKKILKAIREDKNDLKAVLNFMEQYPLSEYCSKNTKTKIINELEQKINNYCYSHLGYNANKAERIESAIRSSFGITAQLKSGNNINYCLSDWQILNYNTNPTHIMTKKVMAELCVEPKEDSQKINNLVLLKSFCHLANLTGAKIICSGIELEKRMKNNI